MTDGFCTGLPVISKHEQQFTAHQIVMASSLVPRVVSAPDELKKAGLLRIITGLVLLMRFSQTVFSSFYIIKGWTSWHFILADTILLLTLLSFTVGFLTRLSTLFSIFLVTVMETFFYAGTLGTVICVQLTFVLLFTGSGYYYAVDAWMQRRTGRLASFLNRINAFPGQPDEKQIARFYDFGFLSYAIVSLAAVVTHAQDEFWKIGDTVSLMLTGAFLSRYYEFFRGFATSFPSFFAFLSKAGILLQTVFQVVMIPAMFFRVGRKFVFWWGMLFFLSALLLLQLSYLAHLEIVLWMLLFWRPGAKGGSASPAVATYRPSMLKLARVFYIGCYAAFCVYFIGLYIRPGKLDYGFLPQSVASMLHKVLPILLHKVGMDTPDVFNATDLRANERWFVIYRLEGNKKVRLPIFDDKGGRLTYFRDPLLLGNHGSDILYDGELVPYRREIVYADVADFHKKGKRGYNIIHAIVRMDRGRYHIPDSVKYYFEVREDRSVMGYYKEPRTSQDRFNYNVIYRDTVIGE